MRVDALLSTPAAASKLNFRLAVGVRSWHFGEVLAEARHDGYQGVSRHAVDMVGRAARDPNLRSPER